MKGGKANGAVVYPWGSTLRSVNNRNAKPQNVSNGKKRRLGGVWSGMPVKRVTEQSEKKGNASGTERGRPDTGPLVSYRRIAGQARKGRHEGDTRQGVTTGLEACRRGN